MEGAATPGEEKKAKSKVKKFKQEPGVNGGTLVIDEAAADNEDDCSAAKCLKPSGRPRAHPTLECTGGFPSNIS